MFLKKNKNLLRYSSSNYFAYLHFIEDLIPKRKSLKILDFGCGNGKLLKILQESNINCEVYGVDVFKNKSLYIEAKQNVPNGKILEISPYQKVDFGEKFDVIVSNQVFEHIKNLDLIYANLSQILNDDGIMICGFPTKEIIIEPHLRLPLIHLINKKSKFLYIYLKIASMISIGQFSKNKKSVKTEKISYLNNRLKYCQEGIFYHSKIEHIEKLEKYFSKVSEISNLYLNYLRNYKTYKNFLKVLIRFLYIKKLKIFFCNKIWGAYFIVIK